MNITLNAYEEIESKLTEWRKKKKKSHQSRCCHDGWEQPYPLEQTMKEIAVSVAFCWVHALFDFGVEAEM